MALLMSETEAEFRNRLCIEKVLNIRDCGREWEVEVKADVKLTPQDFLRLNISDIHNCGAGNKCMFVPKQ